MTRPGPTRHDTAALRRGLLGTAAVVGLLEAGAALHWLDPAALPPVFSVLNQAARLPARAQFRTDLAATAGVWAEGLALACAAGLVLGVLLGAVPAARAGSRAIVEFLRPIPSVALIPLAGFLLGAGTAATTSLVVYASVWPVLFGVLAGLDDVDRLTVDTARAAGLGRFRTLLLVRLPQAAPSLATGVRLASTTAILLDVGVGVLAGRFDGDGLGAYINDLQNGGGAMSLVLAVVLWSALFALAANTLLAAAERRLLHWSPAYRGTAR